VARDYKSEYANYHSKPASRRRTEQRGTRLVVRWSGLGRLRRVMGRTLLIGMAIRGIILRKTLGCFLLVRTGVIGGRGERRRRRFIRFPGLWKIMRTLFSFGFGVLFFL
jgi:hypothetical protein